MKINEFKEKNEVKKEAMDQKLESMKLEKISSLWYSGGSIIEGNCR